MIDIMIMEYQKHQTQGQLTKKYQKERKKEEKKNLSKKMLNKLANECNFKFYFLIHQKKMNKQDLDIQISHLLTELIAI